MIFLHVGIFVFLYIYGLYLWNKKIIWRLNAKISRIIKIIHFFTLALCFGIAFLNYKFRLDLRGIWTTRIIIITALITGIFFISLSHKSIINKFEKIYFRLFSYFPAVVYGFLAIPFLGVVIVISLLGQLICPVEKIYYQDNFIRIQSSFMSVLVGSHLDIFEKKGIFEKHIFHDNTYIVDLDSIKINYDSDSTRIILFRQSRTNNSINKISLKKKDNDSVKVINLKNEKSNYYK